MAIKPTPPKPCAPDSMGMESPSATISRWAPRPAMVQDGTAVENAMTDRIHKMKKHGVTRGKPHVPQNEQ